MKIVYDFDGKAILMYKDSDGQYYGTPVEEIDNIELIRQFETQGD